METGTSSSVAQKTNSALLGLIVMALVAPVVGWLWIYWKLPALIFSGVVLLGGTKFLPKGARWQSFGSFLVYGTFLGTVVALVVEFFYFGI